MELRLVLEVAEWVADGWGVLKYSGRERRVATRKTKENLCLKLSSYSYFQNSGHLKIVQERSLCEPSLNSRSIISYFINN